MLIFNLHVHLLPLAELQLIRAQFFSHLMQLLRLSLAILFFFDNVGLLLEKHFKFLVERCSRVESHRVFGAQGI